MPLSQLMELLERDAHPLGQVGVGRQLHAITALSRQGPRLVIRSIGCAREATSSSSDAPTRLA